MCLFLFCRLWLIAGRGIGSLGVVLPRFFDPAAPSVVPVVPSDSVRAVKALNRYGAERE